MSVARSVIFESGVDGGMSRSKVAEVHNDYCMSVGGMQFRCERRLGISEAEGECIMAIARVDSLLESRA